MEPSFVFHRKHHRSFQSLRLPGATNGRVHEAQTDRQLGRLGQVDIGQIHGRSRDGEQGLSRIRTDNPDLVILDLMLPGMDGVEVCRQVKADPVTRSIPVIMVTAKGEESDIVLGLGIGADDYISKPFSPRELIARVKVVLRRGAGRDRLGPWLRISCQPSSPPRSCAWPPSGATTTAPR